MHRSLSIGTFCSRGAFGSTRPSAQRARQQPFTAAAWGARPHAAEPSEASTAESYRDCGRRDVVASLAGFAALVAGLPVAPAQALEKDIQAGSYLPSAGIDDLVLFVPDKQKTPAIRAGTVDPSSPYRFAVPPTWHELRVANIQSGNYCQPRCSEPWTEVLFESEAEGRLQVIVAPLERLTRKAGATLKDIGTPEGVITSLGPFVTGTYLDEEDVVSTDSKVLDDGRVYYFYEVNASYGTNGAHKIAACTTKGDLALLFVVGATDKQWALPGNQARLRKVMRSFRA